MTTDRSPVVETDRRRFLRASAGTLALGSAAVGGLSRPVRAQSGGLEGWFENVDNYDGVVDATGQSEVTVEVGASGNGGSFAFSPAAVRVDPGTTVVWEWTDGMHNVVADDGSFESELTGAAGHTFEHAFDAGGVARYYCAPHESMGMKGAVLVGAAAAGGDAGAPATGDGGADWQDVLLGGLAGVVLSALAVLPLSERRKRRTASRARR